MLNPFDPLFLEVVNGTLALGCALFLVILLRYMLDPAATDRGKRVARAIGVFVFGIFVFRSWIWVWRHQANDGWSVEWMNAVPIHIAGYVITMVGIFCMIRVFSLSRQPAWVWLGITLVTIGSVTLFAFL